jgi:ketoreductase
VKLTALVTGGTAGIGLAIARSLGTDGYRVAICGRSKARLEAAHAALDQAGVEVWSKPCDVSRREEVNSMVSELVGRWPELDVVVNNAGGLESFPVDQPNDAAWARVVGANLDGAYFVTSRVVSHLRDGGRLIFVSSVLGRQGAPGSAAYCAAKHGVIGFAKAVALELAPRQITVNTICPGWTDTGLARTVMEGVAADLGCTYPEFKEKALSRVPTGRMVDPEEVAAMVRFLVSPAARNITGQAYQICGGQVMI